MTQTAVEWLYKQIQKDQYSDALSPLEWLKVIEQAKQMEKEQMADCWYAGDEDGPIRDFEDYYNETFKEAKQ